MKKKVLFALIALFSFVSAWAVTGVTVGDYTYTLSKSWIVVGEDVPTATVKKGEVDAGAIYLGVYQSDKTTAVATITLAGNYYLKYVVEGKQLFIPFKVGVAADESNYEVVWNAETWGASNTTGGLKAYHEAYPWADYGWWHNGWNAEEEWNTATNQVQFTKWGGSAAPVRVEPTEQEYGEGYDAALEKYNWEHRFVQSWITAINCIDRSWPERTQNQNAVALKTAKTANDEQDEDVTDYLDLLEEGGMPSETWKQYGYPWVVFHFGVNAAACTPVFTYTDGDETYVDESLLNLNFVMNGNDTPTEFATVSGLFEENGYPLTLDVNNKTGEVNNPQEYEEKLDNLGIILLPAKNLDAEIEDFVWSIDPTGAEFTGDPIELTITVGEDENAINSVADEDDFYATYAVKYYDAEGEEVDDMIDAGTYTVELNYILEGDEGDEYDDFVFVPVGETIEFVITPAEQAFPEDAEVVAEDVEYNGDETDYDARHDAAFYEFDEEDYDHIVYVYVGEEEPVAGEDITYEDETEVDNPNHVGFWEMRVYFVSEEQADNYEQAYVSDVFEVTQAKLPITLNVIPAWAFGEDYPSVDEYYSVSRGDYAAGDGSRNVKITGLGNVWPYEQIGSEQSGIAAGTKVGDFRWSVAPGTAAKATTKIDGVEYENYKVQIINANAMIHIGAAALVVGVSEKTSDKIYGFVDPEFVPTFTIESNQIVKTWPLAEEEEAGYIDVDELDDEDEAIYNAEKTMMQTIADNIVITRDGGEGTADYKKKEDVGFYNFIIKAKEGTEIAKNYTITVAEGSQFEIKPYDITPRPAIEDDPATEDVDESKPEDNKNKFVIAFTETCTYTGLPQTPAYTVKFYHDVLGPLPLDLFAKGTVLEEAVEDDPDTDEDESADAVIANDFTAAYGGVNTNVTRDNSQYTKIVPAATLTITAHNYGEINGVPQDDAVEDDGLNKNFKGEKVAKFAINPAPLKLVLGDNTKVYGEEDPDIQVTYVTPVNGENPALDAFWTNSTTGEVNKPRYSREQGEDVGSYRYTCTIPGTSNNYVITFEPAKLTITRAQLTITPDNLGKAFGAAEPQNFTYTVSGLKFDDTFDTTQKLFKREEGETVGTYKIIPVQNAPTTYGDNYTIKYNEGTFTVGTAANQLILIAEDNEKVYGQTDPELSWHAVLLKGYDEENKPIYEDFDMTGKLEDGTTIFVERAPGEDATRTAKGFADDDPANAYTIDFKVSKTVVTTTGTYTYTTSTLPDNIGGYTPSKQLGHFYISKAELRVQPIAKAKGTTDFTNAIVYGQEPAYDIDLVKDNNGMSSDLKNNDQWIGGTNVKAQVLATLVDPKYSGYRFNEKLYNENGVEQLDEFNQPIYVTDEPGTYTITANGGDIKNYVVHYVPGTLTVSASGLTIIAVNQTVLYPEPTNGVYTTPKANLEPTVRKYNNTLVNASGTIDVLDNNKVLPADFDYSTIVELACTATKAYNNEDAITIQKKEGVTTYDVDVTNGSADLYVEPLREIHLAYENVAQALEDHKGLTMDKIYMPNRNLAPEQWSTFVLPFEVDVPELARKLYYGVADVLNPSASADEKDINFNLEMGTIAANEPFIFKVAKYYFKGDKNSTAFNNVPDAQYYFEGAKQVYLADIYFENKTIPGGKFVYNDDEKRPFVESGNVQFIGTYTDKEGVELDEYFMAADGKFHQGSKWTTGDNAKDYILKPTTAYLKLKDASAAADVRIFIEEADGTMTDINAVEAEADAEFAEGWYTVTGVKLDEKPTVKGIYIYNGKKVSIQ